MKHYKDSVSGELYAYALDGSQDEFIKEGLVQVTDEEAGVLRSMAMSLHFDSMTFAEKRAIEYPPITDYLDGIVKGDQAQVAAYVAACLAVKEKFPKPGIDENLIG